MINLAATTFTAKEKILMSISQRGGALLRKNRDVILIGLGFLIVVVTVFQNVELRKSVAACEVEKRVLSEQARLSSSMNQLVGARIPLHDKVRASLGNKLPSGRGGVVLVFSPTACGSNIREQLTVLKDFRRRFSADRLAFLALVGLEAEQDREWALALQERDLLSFPFVYARSEALARSFPLQSESGYTDSPLYFLIDSDFRVRAAFKPNSQKPHELYTWLTSLLEA